MAKAIKPDFNKGRIMIKTIQELDKFIKTAKTGDRAIYHVGNLARDRYAPARALQSYRERAQLLNDVACAVMSAKGIAPVQKPVGGSGTKVQIRPHADTSIRLAVVRDFEYMVQKL